MRIPLCGRANRIDPAHGIFDQGFEFLSLFLADCDTEIPHLSRALADEDDLRDGIDSRASTSSKSTAGALPLYPASSRISGQGALPLLFTARAPSSAIAST